MISAISSIGNNDYYRLIEIQKTLSTQATQSTQETGQSQEVQGNTEAASTQAPPPPPGGNSEMESIKEEAIALAEKVGASVSSDAELDDILDAIDQALTEMQVQAENNPQKTFQLNQLQADYESICQSLSEGNQLQSSLNAMAQYNIAGMSLKGQS